MIKAGQQIIIQPGKPGGPNIVLIQGIPAGSAEEAQQWLEYRVLTADDARRLVYFDVQARKDGSVTSF